MLSTQVVTLARREIVDAWRDRAWVLFAAVISLLLLIGALVGGAQARGESQDRLRLQALVSEQWQNQPDRHPHRVAHYGFIAYRPPGPLRFFDFGTESFTGRSVFLEAHRQNPPNFSEARQSTSMYRFGQLSLGCILQTLMPLLIFFMAFRSITRERESSTYPLLLCQGVSERSLIWGKVVGVSAVVSTLWIPTIVILCALLALSAPVCEVWLRVGLLILSYSIYLLICICLAVGVSARSRTSSGSLLTLLSIWVVLCIFLPRCLPSVAERLWPSPSKPEFELALHQDVAQQGNGHDPKDPRFDALRRQLLENHGETDLAKLPVNYNGLVMQAGERRSSEVYAQHFGSLRKRHQSQNGLSEGASWIDPFLAIRCVSNSLCQTDYLHFVDFVEQAERYRFSMVDRLNDLHAREIPYQGDKEHRVTRDHWKDFEPFSYVAPSLERSLRPLPWVALVAWLGLALWWADSGRNVR